MSFELFGMNAFAAGPDPTRSVIGVTRGLIESLTRDELQGVIAHEYSHIFHGDTRINARTTAAIAGIMLVGTIGWFTFRYIGPQLMRGSRGSKKNDGAAVGIAIVVAGLLIWIIVAEGLEVVHPREPACRGLHAGQIQWLAHPPHERLGKRAAPARQLIQVAARHRAMSRMKAMRHRVHGENVNVGWQGVVDPAAKGFSR